MNAVQPMRLRTSDRDRVVITPEGIALRLTLASRSARAGALIFDLLFIGLLIVFTTVALIAIAGGTIGLMLHANDATPLGHALQFLYILWVAAVFLFRNAYFLFFELGPRGATPGKRIAGIRIAARDPTGSGGGRLTAEMVIARNLLRDIELFLPIVFLAMASDGGDMGAAGMAATAWFLVFALFPCFNRDRLRAGDLIAGSWVVEAPRNRLQKSIAIVPHQSGPEAQVRFSEVELAVYGEYELQTLERILRDNRAEALETVRNAISAKIGRERDPNLPDRAFLESYYTQLRARLESGMRMGRRKADKYG